MSTSTDALAFVGRCLMATLLIMSGFGKVMGPQATLDWIASVGLPQPPIAYVASIAIELGGGLLLILGWQTRIVAALLAIFAIATALIFHRNVADQNQLFHFLKNIAVTGGFLQLMAFGAGRWSVDARMGRVKS